MASEDSPAQIASTSLSMVVSGLAFVASVVVVLFTYCRYYRQEASELPNRSRLSIAGEAATLTLRHFAQTSSTAESEHNDMPASPGTETTFADGRPAIGGGIIEQQLGVAQHFGEHVISNVLEGDSLAQAACEAVVQAVGEEAAILGVGDTVVHAAESATANMLSRDMPTGAFASAANEPTTGSD